MSEQDIQSSAENDEWGIGSPPYCEYDGHPVSDCDLDCCQSGACYWRDEFAGD